MLIVKNKLLKNEICGHPHLIFLNFAMCYIFFYFLEFIQHDKKKIFYLKK